MHRLYIFFLPEIIPGVDDQCLKFLTEKLFTDRENTTHTQPFHTYNTIVNINLNVSSI